MASVLLITGQWPLIHENTIPRKYWFSQETTLSVYQEAATNSQIFFSPPSLLFCKIQFEERGLQFFQATRMIYQIARAQEIPTKIMIFFFSYLLVKYWDLPMTRNNPISYSIHSHSVMHFFTCIQIM